MSELDRKNLRTSDSEQNDLAENHDLPLKPATIGWGVAALALSIFIIVFNNSAIVLGAGFFAKCMAVVAGSALGWGGAMIGDAIRRFAHPDAVFTSGGILQLVWIKIFWALGPQVIGLLIGSLVGVSLMLK
ncbi:hypothetical protein [Pseudomonas sp. A-1]|uniref:hypothetical protein n=1 Tax=Pseudomonas sp. A-1 TaxID=1821274 RepID=UPI001C499F4A|nr:hypothetical protein [Pseudomonas sp. A-1]